MAKKAVEKVQKMKFRTIRVANDVYDRVHKIVGDVAQRGWKYYGIDRRDAASITAVVAEAIERLVRVPR